MKTLMWMLYLFLISMAGLLSLCCFYSVTMLYKGEGIQWLLPAAATAFGAMQILTYKGKAIKPPGRGPSNDGGVT